MALLYNIGIQFYYFLILLASPFNSKARQWIAGRKNQDTDIKQSVDPNTHRIWFHAASLGEFEQGRPVIEAVRKIYPRHRILLTFYSPSGYEVRKNYAGADEVFYLPLDTPGNAKSFIELTNPQLAVFIKYEYWYNMLAELNKRRIPVFVISAILRKEQVFFRWFGGWFRKRLKTISMFFVQDDQSGRLLESIGIKHYEISGDTRFDRVAAIASEQGENSLVALFSEKSNVILGGSTWPPEEKLLADYLQTAGSNIKVIIAPHEVHAERINSIRQLFGNYDPLIYSEATPTNIKHARVLIIDSIGLLAGLYRYCHVALIGGGFGKGIHNILEAVTFGKPVLFGPEYGKFNEAVELVDRGGAFPVNDSGQLKNRLDSMFADEISYLKASEICKKYIRANTGATDVIIRAIRETLTGTTGQ